MGGVERISSWIARPNPSPQFVDFLAKISNPNPNNILPTVVLETGNVAGRSLCAWLRSGFLELQERFLEEVAVAAIWFWGVGWMEKLFDKGYTQLSHKPLKGILDNRIGWTVKKASLALNPLEAFTPSAKVAQKVLLMKGLRLGFSMLSAVGLVAFVVPWLNQKKTEWLLKHFYLNNKNGVEKHDQNKSIQRPEQLDINQSLAHATKSQTMQWSSNDYEAQYRPYQNHVPAFPLSPSISSENRYHFIGHNRHFSDMSSPIRFQGTATTSLNTLGHLVQDTDLGRMFVVDTGIIGGRAISAARRSPFESIEVVLRDVASYYFYFLAVPHTMKALDRLLRPVLKTSFALEPKVAAELNQRLLSQINAVPGKNISITDLKQYFYGLDKARYSGPYRDLMHGMRRTAFTMTGNNFQTLFQKELAFLFPDHKLQHQLVQAIQQHFSPAAKEVGASQIASLLQRISQDCRGIYSRLPPLQKADLSVAVKQAFVHTAGLSKSALFKLNSMKTLNKQLSPEAWQALERRIHRMIERDSMALINTMVRRNIVIAANALGNSHPLIEAAESLSQWIEKPAARGLSFEKFLLTQGHEIFHEMQTLQQHFPKSAKSLIQRNLLGKNRGSAKTLEQIIADLKQIHLVLEKSQQAGCPTWGSQIQMLEARKNMPQAINTLMQRLRQQMTDKNAVTLFDYYASRIKHLSAHPVQGRLFSLELGKAPKPLVEKLDEMLVGGLVRESRLIQEGLRLTGTLVEDSREFVSLRKRSLMQQNIEDYLGTFLRHFSPKTKTVQKLHLARKLDHYFRLSRNCRYLAYGIGILVGMTGLGILIPKVQYFLTRKLTGRNEHPGIEATLKQLEAQQAARFI